MRITLILSCMECGGTPLSVATLANYLQSRGDALTILGLLGEPRDSFYTLQAGVEYIPTNSIPTNPTLLGRLFNYPKTLLKIRKAIKNTRPDIVVSFLSWVNILVILSTCGRVRPLVVSERTSPKTAPSGFIWRMLRKLLYPYADGLVTVSRDGFQGLKLPNSMTKSVIPGPISISRQDLELSRVVQRQKMILGMGRLSTEKGFDILINGFSKVANQFPDWQLKIVGDGPCWKLLEDLRTKSPYSNRIELVPATKTPYTHLMEAGIFVLSSYFEGFPRVLAEAMMFGTPVISTDCPGAVSEFVVDHTNALVVPIGDHKKLAEALIKLTHNKDLRTTLGENARAVATLCSEPALTEWESLIEECVSKNL